MIQNNGFAISNIKIELLKNGVSVWRSKTEVFEKPELWISPFHKDTSINISEFQLKVNEQILNITLKTLVEGINTISINPSSNTLSIVEITLFTS